MNTKILMAVVFCFCAQMAIGQKYYSKTGKISFFSDTDMEKIEAENSSASTVIDFSTGAIEWGVLIQGFKFEKALMQDHFNENYMESSKFPKAKFKGMIENYADIDLEKDGDYKVNVRGELEIHGVTQSVTTVATLTVKKDALSAKSNFSVLIADYGIKVPKLVENNIADEVDIEITADYQLLKPKS
jgi:polyisoprenoid-binding protein YceI